MTLEVRQLVIRSELDNGKGAADDKRASGNAAAGDPCCADGAETGNIAERRARERELRVMLERLGER